MSGTPAATPAPTVPTIHFTDDGRIHTASAVELADASPDTVLDEIQQRVHRVNWFKGYAFTVCIIALLALAAPGGPLFVLLLLASLPGYYIYRWNRERRTARLIYDVDDQDLLYRLSVCNAAGEALSRTASLWHVYSSQAVADRKRNAGASALVQRTVTRCHPGSLPGIELNIEPWSITVGPQQLLFLPDRLLVHENRKFAAVPYEHLSAEFSVLRFIEEGAVPPDARQVDVTWRYVNKSGGPDRRFNDNRQIPVLEYGRLALASRTGMMILLDSSNVEATATARKALVHLSEIARRGSEATPASLSAGLPLIERPSGTRVADYDEDRLLLDVAIVLRFIAAADRRISDEEVDVAANCLARISTNQQKIDYTVSSFRSLSSSEADSAQAVARIARHSMTVIREVVASAETLAGADGRFSPKERERLAALAGWASAAAVPTTA